MKVSELIKIVPITCDVYFVNSQQADLCASYRNEDKERPPRETKVDDCEVISILSVDSNCLVVMLRNENDVNGQ